MTRIMKIRAKIKLGNSFFEGWFTPEEIKNYEYTKRVISIFQYYTE